MGNAAKRASLYMILLGLWSGSAGLVFASPGEMPEDAQAQADGFLQRYCSRCHNEERFAGYWALVDVDLHAIARGEQLEAWEKILRMTRDGDMPPPLRKKQPSPDDRAQFAAWLQGQLDGYSARHPHPGHSALRRLNRAEYANAVRDLLGVDLVEASSLPADDSGYGFDNIADVLTVSSTLMDRYFAVAGRVSRLALGVDPAAPARTGYQVPKDGSILNQGVPSFNERSSGALPIDSRGGGAFEYYAPHAGYYELAGFLNANTNNEVDRLPENRYAQQIWLDAGPHTLGMSFRRELGLDESVQTLRNTTDIVPMPVASPALTTLDFVVDGARVASANVPTFHESPRFAQKNFLRDVLQIEVEGPLPTPDLEATRAASARELPSREAILRCRPGRGARAEQRCAKRILRPLLRRAYRRPATAEDLASIMKVFTAARAQSDFDEAIATAVQALLVAPRFLFVVEDTPPGLAPGTPHRVTDTEFATRLALFLWSSGPDDELLSLAQRQRLRRPRILRAQVARMLDDERAAALTENFAGQWLFLRNLDYHRADVEAYPDFDVRLRAAMREETERFFAAVVREDRSLLDFLKADYSFLNERLATHYGLEGVYGPAFRRVALPATAQRGGLLGQASLLTLTSYGNHTSVVRRGQWILDALLAAPPPPAPPDVPALVAERSGRALTARQQLELHRAKPACASCHVKMDPLGLALEGFDAIGASRSEFAGQAIDLRASLPDGTTFEGLPGLQTVLLARRDQFLRAFTEQLMIYALGRGIQPQDRPTIRAIAADAAADGYRAQQVLLGIINSYAFNHRRSPES
ncbi:MAG: DUF1592 domain-containing protein [Pseudomonadota bacterium]